MPSPRRRKPPRERLFDPKRFLQFAGPSTRVATYETGARIFSQGDPSDKVIYIQEGTVKLSVVSKVGKEAVIAILKSGDFFGEGCLAGQPLRMGTATTITATTVMEVKKARMVKLLHEHSALSDLFIAHILDRNIRIEEDLIDQLFNSSEKRLARALLLLARYGKQDGGPARMVPRISQETLAKMVGTTRSRVNFFLNKFKKLGFIEYNGEIPLKINSSLISVVLHD
jgi:CRP/FNR family transcriptional regulator, cyclic AMP receptor protein